MGETLALGCQFKRIAHGGDCVTYQYNVSAGLQASDLDVELVREARGAQVDLVELVIGASGMELERTELPGPCNWVDLRASLDKRSRVLSVTIKLAEDGAEDALVAPLGAAEAEVAAASSAAQPQERERLEQGGAAAPLPNGTAHAGAAEEARPQRVPVQSESEASSDAASFDTARDELEERLSLTASEEQEETPAAAAPAAEPKNEAAAPAPVTPQPTELAEAPQHAGKSGAGGEAPPAKKKKKKKKKKGQAAAGEEEAKEEEGEDEGALDESPAAAEAASNKAATDTAAEQEQQEAPQREQKQQEQQQQEQRADAEPAAEATDAAAVVTGRTELGRALERRQFSGPAVAHALSKDRNKDKGEDQWLVKPSNAWALEGAPGETSFGAWGILDGHGGRQVATFASNALLRTVMAEVDAGAAPLAEVPPLEGLAPEDVEEWRLQATLARRLPPALVAGFRRCNEEACRRFKRGGTTATLAVAVGWELLVANVGDSCAYLDTGTEVLQVSATHRLEDNKAEVERVQAEGGEVAQATADGVPVGPIRVWPGGLAMSRTIGDYDAGDLVPSEPEVCQVTIPATGARLLIGSDGLWDAIHPKTAAHHCREMVAAEAAHKLLALAIRHDRLKDDVTVIVVDFLPHPSDKLPPGFVTHPLAAGTAPHDFVAAGAERRQHVLAELVAVEEEQRAEEARREQKKQEAFHLMLKRSVQRQGADASTASEGGGGSLYEELANLRLSPEEVEQAKRELHMSQQQVEQALEKVKRETQEEAEAAAAAVTEGLWETVPGAEARQARQPPAGGRGGRGRGARGGGPGRGRGGRGRGGRGAAPAELQDPTDTGFGPPSQPGTADAAVHPPPADAGAGGDDDAPKPQRVPRRGGRTERRGGGAPAAANAEGDAVQVPVPVSKDTAGLYFRPVQPSEAHRVMQRVEQQMRVQQQAQQRAESEAVCEPAGEGAPAEAVAPGGGDGGEGAPPTAPVAGTRGGFAGRGGRGGRRGGAPGRGGRASPLEGNFAGGRGRSGPAGGYGRGRGGRAGRTGSSDGARGPAAQEQGYGPAKPPQAAGSGGAGPPSKADAEAAVVAAAAAVAGLHSGGGEGFPGRGRGRSGRGGRRGGYAGGAGRGRGPPPSGAQQG
eukprot:scaffold13.g204.t1